MQSHIGGKASGDASFTDDDVRSYLWRTLRSGQVIPGYGHAVLRKPDPRFKALMDFASARAEIAWDPIFKLVQKTAEIAPSVLLEHGKVSSLYIVAKSSPTETNRIDEKPLSECRLCIRCSLPSLRLHTDAVLHCHFRRQSWDGPAGPVDLGSRFGLAH